MKHKIIWLALVLACSLPSDAVELKKKLTVKRIEVSSDSNMRVQTKDHWAEFNNNVDIKLDDFRLRCDRLHLTYSEGKDGTSVDTLKAEGNVMCNDRSRGIEAKSDRLDYDKNLGWLVFSSQLKTTVIQQGNHMEAKAIKVNIETGDVLVDGKGRVEIDLQGL